MRSDEDRAVSPRQAEGRSDVELREVVAVRDGGVVEMLVHPTVGEARAGAQALGRRA